mmetsp:Transcript_10125/g.14855  ORF Transcript_10125/g.14855 Transcript_10125/m.14855 type:complete len:176 (+) Transcript_10125:43-570(+)
MVVFSKLAQRNSVSVVNKRLVISCASMNRSPIVLNMNQVRTIATRLREERPGWFDRFQCIYNCGRLDNKPYEYRDGSMGYVLKFFGTLLVYIPCFFVFCFCLTFLLHFSIYDTQSTWDPNASPNPQFAVADGREGFRLQNGLYRILNIWGVSIRLEPRTVYKPEIEFELKKMGRM